MDGDINSINFQFEITDNPQDTLYQILIGTDIIMNIYILIFSFWI